jgi:hypothetical protein
MKRKREETATWGAVRNSEFIVTEKKTKLSSSVGFQVRSSPTSGNSRLERGQSIWSKGAKEMKRVRQLYDISI